MFQNRKTVGVTAAGLLEMLGRALMKETPSECLVMGSRMRTAMRKK
jgi:hypothetical protein